MMRKLAMIQLLLYGLLSNGCALVKKQAASQQQQLKQEYNKQQTLQQQLSKRQHSQWQDSTGITHWVEIWPKGKFSFTTDSGFVGEAEKIKWMGSYLKRLNLKDDTYLQLNHTLKTSEQQKRNDNFTLKNKSVEREPWLQPVGYLWLLIGFMGALYGWYRYKNR